MYWGATFYIAAEYESSNYINTLKLNQGSLTFQTTLKGRGSNWRQVLERMLQCFLGFVKQSPHTVRGRRSNLWFWVIIGDLVSSTEHPLSSAGCTGRRVAGELRSNLVFTYFIISWEKRTCWFAATLLIRLFSSLTSREIRKFLLFLYFHYLSLSSSEKEYKSLPRPFFYIDTMD